MSERRAGAAAQPHVPEWLVERLAAGDLPAAQAEQVQRRLEEAGELGRLRVLEASNRALLEAHPPAAAAVEVRRRLARANPRAASPRPSRAWVALSLGGAAAALLSLLFVNTQQSTERGVSAPASEERVRLKGLEPHLVLYAKRPSGAVRLASPARAAAGDVIQLAYVAAGRKYGVVVSTDSTGALTLHLPEAPGAAALLAPQAETPLPHAFELDSAPGAEHFLFVTADHPFDVEAVTSALRQGAPLPRDLSTHQLHLQKDRHE